MKNEDKIDESHKSQLKFEYEIYLLNYTIRIKNLKTYIGLLRFFRFFKKPKNLGFLKPTSTALAFGRSVVVVQVVFCKRPCRVRLLVAITSNDRLPE